MLKIKIFDKTNIPQNGLPKSREVIQKVLVPFFKIRKSQKIINDHIEHRRLERKENPDRFQVKPTIGELCLRRPPPLPSQPSYDQDSTQQTMNMEPSQKPGGEDHPLPLPMSREPSVQFKEVQVKQLDKTALYNMPVQGY